MRKREREKFRSILVDIRKNILRDIQQNIQEGQAEAAGDGRDTYDIASDERDREISLLLSGRDRQKLQQVDDALQRLDAGEYGVCDECGGEIGVGRLQVMPFTHLCVTCQGEFEQTQRTVRSDQATIVNPRYPAAGNEEESS